MRKANPAMVLIAIVLFASGAAADRLILIPTGATLGTGEFRAEYAASGGQNATWAATGVMRLEVEGAWFSGFAPSSDDAWSAQIAILPETSFTPALGVGVRDIGDGSDKSTGLYDGRSLYAAATKEIELGEVTTFVQDLKITAGIGTGSLNGIFFGADAGIAERLRLAAEYDTKDINLAATYGLAPLVNVRVSSIHGDVYYGLLISYLR